MNYYGAKELADAFRTVRANTITIAQDIPENDYGFQATPDTLTVAQILVHIGTSPILSEQVHGIERRTTMEGFDFASFIRQVKSTEQQERTKEEILKLLRENGDRFANWLDTLTDDFLGQRVGMPPGVTPPSKTRFEMLLGVKEHEMHHRGQLMVLQRLLGLTPHLTRLMQERMAAMTKAASTPA